MKMRAKLFGLTASFILAGIFSPVLADDATPVATAAATPAPPAVTVGGLVDAYYSYNFTNSANHDSGIGNTGYFYNSVDGSYDLGLAEAKLAATQGLASGHLVLAYGQELGLSIGSTVPGIDVLQAYVSYAPGEFTLSAGRFVTWMGNEVIESTGNWNYSRSLLFNYTIPLWHDGISVAYTPSSTFKIAGYATNGWNNATNVVGDSSAQTYGLSLGIAPSSVWSFTVNGIDGPGNTALTTISSDRYVGEAIIDFNATSDWSFALDAEAGGQDSVSAAFWGADLYAKYAISSNWSAALRLEELCDNQDTLGIYGTANGGTPGKAYEGREATLTLAHNFTTAWSVSLEGRYDYALENGAVLGAKAGPFAAGSDDELTTTLGTAIAF